jgi:hypothetical protein
VELVVDAACAERGMQFRPHPFGQLSAMDADWDEGRDGGNGSDGSDGIPWQVILPGRRL